MQRLGYLHPARDGLIRALPGMKLRVARSGVASIHASSVQIRQALVAGAFFLADHCTHAYGTTRHRTTQARRIEENGL
jgi:hypothetical protein